MGHNLGPLGESSILRPFSHSNNLDQLFLHQVHLSPLFILLSFVDWLGLGTYLGLKY